MLVDYKKEQTKAMNYFEKVASYEDAIMEKVALNAAAKRYESGNMTFGEFNKIRKYEEKLHSKGHAVKTIHDRINSRQNAVNPSDIHNTHIHKGRGGKEAAKSHARIPVKGTLKNYIARSTSYKEKQPEVLGTSRTAKFLGHRSAEALAKLKNAGFIINPTERVRYADNAYTTAEREVHGSTGKILRPIKLNLHLAKADKNKRRKTSVGADAIANGAPRRLTDKAERARIATHETEEAKQIARRYAAAGYNFYDAQKIGDRTTIGTHADPEVLWQERNAANRLRDAYAWRGLDRLRSEEKMDYGPQPNVSQQAFVDHFTPNPYKVTRAQKDAAYNWRATGDSTTPDPTLDRYRRFGIFNPHKRTKYNEGPFKN